MKQVCQGYELDELNEWVPYTEKNVRQNEKDAKINIIWTTFKYCVFKKKKKTTAKINTKKNSSKLISAFTCCCSFEPSYSVLSMQSSRQDFCFFSHMTYLFSLQLWRSKSFICSCMFSDKNKKTMGKDQYQSLTHIMCM